VLVTLINAAWGLGEAIVGGLVTPDTVVVEKASGAITRQEITEKNVMTVRTPEGTHEETVSADRRTQAVLSPAQAAELARIGVQIEDLNEQPMDIEWALSDGRFFIVQARPITTLRGQTPALEEWNDSLSGDYLWTCANVGEAVPDVMTPCTWSLIQVFVAKTMGPLFLIGLRYHPLGNIGGRFYMNVGLAMSASAKFGVGRKRFVALTEEMFGAYLPIWRSRGSRCRAGACCAHSCRRRSISGNVCASIARSCLRSWLRLQHEAPRCMPGFRRHARLRH
jgi:hypothetical protein